MSHDLKARNIQVEQIQSVKPYVISGDVAIPVDAKLRYTEGFTLDDDYDLVYKSWVQQNAGGYVYFTDNSSGAISVDLSLGTITIPDVENDFPVLSANGIIRANIDVLISGTWYANDVLPDVTKDGLGNILTAVFNLGNTDITTIRGRIY